MLIKIADRTFPIEFSLNLPNFFDLSGVYSTNLVIRLTRGIFCSNSWLHPLVSLHSIDHLSCIFVFIQGFRMESLSVSKLLLDLQKIKIISQKAIFCWLFVHRQTGSTFDSYNSTLLHQFQLITFQSIQTIKFLTSHRAQGRLQHGGGGGRCPLPSTKGARGTTFALLIEEIWVFFLYSNHH